MSSPVMSHIFGVLSGCVVHLFQGLTGSGTGRPLYLDHLPMFLKIGWIHGNNGHMLCAGKHISCGKLTSKQ